MNYLQYILFIFNLHFPFISNSFIFYYFQFHYFSFFFFFSIRVFWREVNLDPTASSDLEIPFSILLKYTATPNLQSARFKSLPSSGDVKIKHKYRQKHTNKLMNINIIQQPLDFQNLFDKSAKYSKSFNNFRYASIRRSPNHNRSLEICQIYRYERFRCSRCKFSFHMVSRKSRKIRITQDGLAFWSKLIQSIKFSFKSSLVSTSTRRNCSIDFKMR